MAEYISDRRIAAVLRPFVRAAGPIVVMLRSSPGRERTSGSDRTDWWINRVGRFGAGVTAAPGLAGALSDRLPVQEVLGLATQGVLLCALASERGITEVGDRVRLLAWVLFDRDIDRDLAAGTDSSHSGADSDPDAERAGEEAAGLAKGGRSMSFAVAARTVWRFGRRLLAISNELDKRPSGRIHHEAMGMLPVVGILGDYLGERSGLKRAAASAERWMTDST